MVSYHEEMTLRHTEMTVRRPEMIARRFFLSRGRLSAAYCAPVKKLHENIDARNEYNFHFPLNNYNLGMSFSSLVL